MEDQDLRELLKEIDQKFQAIMPLLERVGKALAEKVRRETGVEVCYSIGWEEAGINTLCLLLEEGRKGFKNYKEASDWLDKNIYPLFDGCKVLNFDVPFSLGEWDEN